MNQQTKELFSAVSQFLADGDTEKRQEIRAEIENLLGRGASVREKNHEGKTVLHLAALQGDEEIVARLIAAGADVNEQDNVQRTPAFFAVSAGICQALEKLIKNNARLDIPEFSGNTLLHSVSLLDEINGRPNEIAEILFGSEIFEGTHFQTVDSYINCKSNDGRTPLHLAADFNRAGLARLLIYYGADIDAADNKGYKPLHLAAENHSKDVIILFNEILPNRSGVDFIDDYQKALNLINLYTPSHGKDEIGKRRWNAYFESKQILESVVTQYRNQTREEEVITNAQQAFLNSPPMQEALGAAGHPTDLEEAQLSSAIENVNMIIEDEIEQLPLIPSSSPSSTSTTTSFALINSSTEDRSLQ